MGDVRASAVRRFCIVVALLYGFEPAALAAQTETESKWLVLPSVVATQGDPKHPARAAARLLAEDLRAHGRRAFAVEEAKALFEQHGSAPPMTASAADIDELAKDAQRALYHVASGLPARAKMDVERALGRARRALESLNRETRAAQHLLDACLYLVRAHLQHNRRADARRQALDCRRLVPDISPEPTIHPPDVIGVLAEAQAQLRATEPASLRVESEPSGCAAFVNGRNLGPTPKELSRLSPGEYRIQVECEQGVMGRVHRVALTSHRVVLKVDTRFDRVIETLFDLSLNYALPNEASRFRARDAVETGRIVGASDVVVAWQSEHDAEAGAAVQLDRYRVADGVYLGSVRLGLDGDAALPERVLVRAREALQAGESIDLTGPAPVALAQPEPGASALGAPGAVESRPAAAPASAAAGPKAAADADASEADVRAIAGYALGGLGLAAQAAGWVLYGRLLASQSDYADALNANADPAQRTVAELNALRDLDAADDAPPIALGTGAVLAAVSLPLWLPDEASVPWWSWTAGGAGLAIAAAGAVLAFGAADCELDRYDRCTDPALATDVGPMLLLQSIPLLALPVVHAVRSSGDGGARLAVEVGGDRAFVRVGGTL